MLHNFANYHKCKEKVFLVTPMYLLLLELSSNKWQIATEASDLIPTWIKLVRD